MPEELTNVLCIARADLQQIAVIAGDVVQLEDLRTLGQGLRDAVVAKGLLAADGDESEHRLFELMRIDQGRISLDYTAGLELPDPLKNR